MNLNASYSSDLATALEGVCHVPAGLNTQIHGLKIDSRKVEKGDLFLAISEDQEQRQAHVKEAIANGANAVVVELPTMTAGEQHCQIKEDAGVVELFVSDLDAKCGKIASQFYRNPSSSMSVIGVTGTNGKTSVTTYAAQILSELGTKTGVLGTLGYGFPADGDDALTQTNYTTPDVVNVHRCLAELKDYGAKAVMMEVSSHALEQGRVDAVQFEGAVFTNLSRDHLDYHGSMKEYLNAKLKLFKIAGLHYVILNKDDPVFESVRQAVASDVNVLSFSTRMPADVQATEVLLEDGISAYVSTPTYEHRLESDLLGEFNLSNLLAVVGLLEAKKIELKDFDVFEVLRPVDGRMEMIRHEGLPYVVVDYAHTPDALDKVLKALRPHCKGELLVVFGCGGDRDQGKRAEMGRVAEANADRVVLTDDNPRTESPDEIVNQILSGMTGCAKSSVIRDRALAIKDTLQLAKEGDIVLIAGKGHEQGQEINGEVFEFNDLAVARNCLDELHSVIGCKSESGVSCD